MYLYSRIEMMIHGKHYDQRLVDRNVPRFVLSHVSYSACQNLERWLVPLTRVEEDFDRRLRILYCSCVSKSPWLRDCKDSEKRLSLLHVKHEAKL